MANELIRPKDLPSHASPVATDVVPSDNGTEVGKVTLAALVASGRPLASQAEAEGGTEATKAMTPLTTKQAFTKLARPNTSFEGPWETGTPYTLYQSVSEGGSSYVCIVAHTSGTFADDLTAGYWTLIAEKGDTGATGPQGPQGDVKDADLGTPTAIDLTNATGLDTVGSGAGVLPQANGGSVTFSTVALAEDYSPVVAPDYARTSGYASAGDYGGALYKLVATEPAWDLGKFPIVMPDRTTTKWYGLAEWEANQYMFDAVGDGDADDTDKLLALHDYCERQGALFRYAPGTHKVSDTITFATTGDASAATFNIDASSVARGVLVGTTAAGEQIYRLAVYLPTIINSKKTATDWTGFDTAIGVELANLYESRVYEKLIYGFGIGMTAGGYGTGFVYNHIFLQNLYNNKIQLRLKAGDDSGWTNENIWDGGRFPFDSGEGSNIAGARFVQLIESSAAALNGPPNNNVFLKPSLEGDGPEYHVDIQGSYNTIIAPRMEGTRPSVRFYARTNNQTGRNLIIGGYNTDAIAYTFAGAPIAATASNLPSFLSSTGSGTKGALALTSSSGDSASTPHAWGWPAGTQLLGQAGTESTWLYRLYGQGFDGKQTGDAYPRISTSFRLGQMLFGGGSATPVAGLSGSGSGLFNLSGFFAPNITGMQDLGSTSLMWRNGYIQNARVGNGTNRLTNGSAAPTTGAWVVGDIVLNTAPTAGGNIGWVCTTAGSPGTWKTFGAIAS